MIRQKGGGRSGVQRTPRFGAREQKIRSDEDTALSKLSPKDPKEIAKKFRDATGEPREKRLLHITNSKATRQRLHLLFTYTQRSVADALRLKFFFFLSVHCGGQLHSCRESSCRTTHLLRFPVDCMAEYLNTISSLLLRLLLSLQLQLQPTTLSLT